jgi:hypothetical protein
MTLPFLRKFSTAGAAGDGRLAYLNADGAFIGRGVPLLERDAYGRFQPRDLAVLEALLAKGYGAPVEVGWRASRLNHVAEALNKGDLALAGISLVRLELPPLPSDDHAQAMAEADEWLSKAYDPDQPRAPKGDPNGGQWTSGDAGGAEAAPSQGAHAGGEREGIELAADREDPTHAKKRLFIEAHLADAQKAAAELHVPVENILGISALETEWGQYHFAAEGNNYFGLRYPTRRATGFVVSKDFPHPKVATYASYADCLSDFVDKYKKLISGVKDPGEFSRILQEAGKFGVDTVTGKPLPEYTSKAAATIRSLRKMIGGRAV